MAENNVMGYVKGGAPVVLRADSQPTAAYVAGTAIDLYSYSGTFVHPIVGTSAVGTVYMKNQWSLDNTNWGDGYMASVSGSVSGGEMPFTVAPSVFQIDLQRTGKIGPSYLPRQGRYYRPVVKWVASTAGTLAINALPANNLA